MICRTAATIIPHLGGHSLLRRWGMVREGSLIIVTGPGVFDMGGAWEKPLAAEGLVTLMAVSTDGRVSEG